MIARRVHVRADGDHPWQPHHLADALGEAAVTR